MNLDVILNKFLGSPEISIFFKSEIVDYVYGINFILLCYFIDLIRPYFEILGVTTGEMREYDLLSSGYEFFSPLIYFFLCFPTKNSLSFSLKYTLLYMLVDSYMDDVKISKEEKKDGLRQMKILINNPSERHSMKLDNLSQKQLFKSAEIYEDLTINYPHCKESLLNLFQKQLEGIKIQENPNCNLEEFWMNTRNKGNATIRVILDFAQMDYDLIFTGEIGQLVDDICDMRDDITSGHSSIATAIFKKYGNIDLAILRMFELTDKMPEEYKILQGFFYPSIIYTIYQAYDYLSPEIQNVLNVYRDTYSKITNPLNKFFLVLINKII